MNRIRQSDIDFMTSLLKRFNIPRVYLQWSDSRAKYPDIWVQLSTVPVITVTAEWARQNTNEREKRILHEFLHILGMKHNSRIGYNSIPDKDVFSKRVYQSLRRSL